MLQSVDSEGYFGAICRNWFCRFFVATCGMGDNTQIYASGRDQSISFGAEGETAPETLRHQGPPGEQHSGKQSVHTRLTEGVTVDIRMDYAGISQVV